MHASRLTSLSAIMTLATACNHAPSAVQEDGSNAVMEAYVAAFCDGFFDCACPGRSEVEYQTREDCTLAEMSKVETFLAYGQEQGLTFDPSCVTAVRARFEALGCSPDWRNTPPWQDSFCKSHFGKRAKGETCTLHRLANGDDCLPDLGCRDGRCDDLKPRLYVGDACDLSWPYCIDGSICIDLDNDGASSCEKRPLPGEQCLPGNLCFGLYCAKATTTCEERGSLGQACDLSDPACGTGLTCAVSGAGGDTKCVEAPTSGFGEDCTTRDCAEGLSCDLLSGVCVQEIPFVCSGAAVEPLPSPITPSDE